MSEQNWLNQGKGSLWSDYQWYAEFESESAWKECKSELYDLNYPDNLDEILKEHAVRVSSTWNDDE
jgi:hypothetical protein